MQEAYWLGRQSLVELGEVACHVYVELRVRALDLDRLTWAWRAVIDRHPDAARGDRARMARSASWPKFRRSPLPSPITVRPRTRKRRAAARAVREAMSHQVLPCDRWPLFEVRVTRVQPTTGACTSASMR